MFKYHKIESLLFAIFLFLVSLIFQACQMDEETVILTPEGRVALPSGRLFPEKNNRLSGSM